MKRENFTDSEFEELLSKFDYNFKKGDLVKGIVCAYDSEGAIVDIGAKTSAIVPTREASVDNSQPLETILEKGSEYEFLIINDEDEDGKFVLSRKKVDLAYIWKDLQKLKDEDEIILGEISSIVKGGVLVDILGVKGFVPSSHLKNKDAELQVGDKLELKILTLDSQQNNFILSNKKAFAETTEESRQNIFSQIEIGQVVKGEVVRITNFGAFVDIGGIDGLLPLSQISWRWVEHPTDLLKLGEKIEVEVIDLDLEKQRVSLSLKNLEPDPWIEAEKNLQEGVQIEGIVTRIKNFGAFVEILSGVEALLPQSELIEYQNKHNKILQAKDKILTTVWKFNPADKRISLSIKTPEELAALQSNETNSEAQ